MEVLLGGIAGAVSGFVGAFVAAIVQITTKRVRNARLVRRGEPPIRDVIFTPFYLLLGISGFIAGAAWTWILDGTWVIGAISGAELPALLALVWLVTGLARLRR